MPNGVELVRSPTETGWLISQVQIDGAAVNQFQAGLSATPFSQWGKPYIMTSAGTVNPQWNTQSSPLQQVAAMDAATFFTVFADFLRRNPPHANDYPMRERMRRISLGYEPFSFSRLDPAVLSIPPLAWAPA